MNKYEKLKKLIDDSETLVVPDAYDGISAKIIEHIGFKAVQCSGYSISISKKIKDESLLSIDENMSKTQEIVAAVKIPVMADAEDGYGYKEIFRNNIIKFINTGIAGINIEDQNLWDPYRFEKIMPFEIMSEKILEILKIKKEFGIQSFVLNARTDALKSTDDRKKALEIAILRGNQYLELGADMCFIPYVKTKEEIKLLKREINGPLSIAAGLPYNINEFSIKDCVDLGIARVSIPCILIFGALDSMLFILKEIKDKGTFENILNHRALIGMPVLQELLK